MLNETPWETRNLGLPAFAVAPEFWEAPDFGALGERLATIERGFVSARILAHDVRHVDPLSRLGFYVVEAATEFSASLRDDATLAAYDAEPDTFVPRRLVAADVAIEIEDAPRAKWRATIAQMAAGAFSTDRFHRDYRCPAEVAERRTQLWLEQLSGDSGAELLVITYRGDPAAYSYRIGPRVLMGNTGAQFSYRGLGRLLIVATRDRARATGHATSTSVATSSVESLNAHFRSGFQARRQTYTLHWWSSETPY